MYSYYLEREVARQKGRMKWFQENMLQVLEKEKEKQVKGIDYSIELVKELQKVLDSPQPKPKPIPPPRVEPKDEEALMKPIEPQVLDILYRCPDNRCSEKYLKTRCQKKVDDRYYSRLSVNWDYGWELNKSMVRPRDVNFGRCAAIKKDFYRIKNLAPDPPHYTEPTMGDPTFCK